MTKKPVVLISSIHDIPWCRQFPDGNPVWDGWRFIFNDYEADYDYLVVFDDLDKAIEIRCPPTNTIHVVTEPIIVGRIYYRRFINQFAISVTLTNRLKHRCAIETQPGLNWHLGWNPKTGNAPGAMSFEELLKLFDRPKTKLISVISSNSQSTKPHRKRLLFAKKLKAYFGDQIDFFGRGIRSMEDKLEALQDYRFNVVLENSSENNYFTEKLADCFISGCYPIYWGCPNLEHYFSSSSFSRINIEDFEGSVAEIKRVIDGEYDKKYRTELRQSRDLIMYEYNLFPMLIKIINENIHGKHGAIPDSNCSRIVPLATAATFYDKVHWQTLRSIRMANKLIYRS